MLTTRVVDRLEAADALAPRGAISSRARRTRRRCARRCGRSPGGASSATWAAVACGSSRCATVTSWSASRRSCGVSRCIAAPSRCGGSSRSERGGRGGRDLLRLRGRDRRARPRARRGRGGRARGRLRRARRLGRARHARAPRRRRDGRGAPRRARRGGGRRDDGGVRRVPVRRAPVVVGRVPQGARCGGPLPRHAVVAGAREVGRPRRLRAQRRAHAG